MALIEQSENTFVTEDGKYTVVRSEYGLTNYDVKSVRLTVYEGEALADNYQYSINVYAPEKYPYGKPYAEVNWAALGSQQSPVTRFYAELLMLGADIADELNEAFEAERGE